MLELMLSVAVIAVLLAMLVFAVQAMRVQAAMTECANNLQQIGLAIQNYRTTGDDPPRSAEVRAKITPYLQNATERTFRCPEYQSDVSYGVNFCFERFQPSDNKLVAMDATNLIIPFLGGSEAEYRNIVAARHRGTFNALFYDGRVQRFTHAEISPYDPSRGSENIRAFWEPERKGCEFCSPGGEYEGSYWNTSDWGNTAAFGPGVKRPETTLYMPFGANPGMQFGVPYNLPIPNPEGHITVRLKGKLRIDKTDNYTFWVVVDNDAKIFFDGVLVKERRAGGWGYCTTCVQYSEPFGPISLNAGQWVHFDIWARNYGGPTHFGLQWSTPSSPTPTNIPSSNLLMP